MSKEEFLKIQTCVLKVNIHCDGCKHKVKKILQKIDGVFTTSIDSEQGKVTISGNVEPSVLMKKLAKAGKHAELWGTQKANNNNHNHLTNQFKNMKFDGGKGGGGNNGQKGHNDHPKGGHGQPNQNQMSQQIQQMLQQQQQIKTLQDLNSKMAQMKMANSHNQKGVKFASEDDDLSDDEFDDDDDLEFDDDDDEFDDEDLDDELDDDHHPLNKMRPAMPNGNMMMMNAMHPQHMNVQKGAPNGGGGNGKKPPAAGGNGNGAVPVQINGGKKGGGGANNNGGNQNQGVGGVNKNGNNMQMNGGKNGNGGGVNDALRNMAGPPYGPPGQMGKLNMPIGQMGSIPVQGLPAGGGSGGGNGYMERGGSGPMPGNPYQQQQQQQYLQSVMNQQSAMGNERFQPMMYARPPPLVNYMPPYPSPYRPSHLGSDPYTDFFNDENTSSCNVM